MLTIVNEKISFEVKFVQITISYLLAHFVIKFIYMYLRVVVFVFIFDFDMSDGDGGRVVSHQ